MSRMSVVALSLLVCSCVSSPRGSGGGEPPCGEVSAWRARALERSSGEVRKALTRWTPGAAVADADRVHVATLAREHLVSCGTEEVVRLTSTLVSFKTVSAHRDAGTQPEFARMGEFLRGWAEQRGMHFQAHGNDDVWELSFGGPPDRAAPPGLGFVLHGDVVPASSDPTFPPVADSKSRIDPKRSNLPRGWSRPAFTTTREGDLLYGRGTEDDKGPMAAVLVMMDTLRLFDLTPRTRMVAIIGNGEEDNWEPMVAYTARTPPPQFTISVDANFPLVIAEAGFVAWHLLSPQQAGKAIRCAQVVDARGGEFITQIPGDAELTLRPGAAEGVEALLARARAIAADEIQRRGAPFRAEVARDGERVVIRTWGASYHSSEPEKGSNALWPLAAIATRVGVCDGGAGALLRLIAERMDGDHLSRRLGLAYADTLTGPLVQAPTVLRVEDGVARLQINLRRPGGKSNEEFTRRLDAVTSEVSRAYGVTEDLTQRRVRDPHVADVKGPLVTTLLDIYRRERPDPSAQPLMIRGGTYGRLFPGAVSFGPGLPGLPYRGHGADEAIEISSLAFQTRVLFDAAVRLEPLTIKASR